MSRFKTGSAPHALRKKVSDIISSPCFVHAQRMTDPFPAIFGILGINYPSHLVQYFKKWCISQTLRKIHDESTTAFQLECVLEMLDQFDDPQGISEVVMKGDKCPHGVCGLKYENGYSRDVWCEGCSEFRTFTEK